MDKPVTLLTDLEVLADKHNIYEIILHSHKSVFLAFKPEVLIWAM